MRARLFVLVVLSSLVVATRLLPAQTPASAASQAPGRPSSAAVRLDLFALIDGQPVDDLVREQIELREDGVAQAIATFEHVRIVPSQDATSQGALGRDGAPSERRRVFGVFVDTHHTSLEAVSEQRVALVKFLDSVIGPDDAVVLVTPETVTDPLTFASKGAVLSNLAQPDWEWARHGSSRADPKEALYDECYPAGSNGRSPAAAQEMKARRREKLTLDALDLLVSRLGPAREERKAVLAITDGWELFQAQPPETSRSTSRRPSPTDIFRRRRGTDSDNGETPRGVSGIECETDRTTLAALDHSTRLLELAEEANRHTIAFYPISPAVLTPSDDQAPATRSGSRTLRAVPSAAGADSTRFLAENTDGVSLTDPRQIDRVRQRLIDDQSSYYLLSYVSTNAKLDGRLRAVSVRTTRPDVRIRTRRGYRGRSAEDLLRESTTSTAAPPSTSIDVRAPFRVRASAWAEPGAGGDGGGALWLVGELDFRTRRELAWTAGAEADVTVLGADGTTLVSRTVQVPAADGGFGVRVPEDSTLKPGDYAVRVRVRPQGAEDLAFTDTARVVVGGGRSALGEAVLWRRGVSTGPRYLMTADARFQRSDRIRLELPTVARGLASARMLDRAGQVIRVPVTVTERDDASGRFRWLTADAALAPLAMGEYAIEVAMGDSRQVTPFRVVP